MINTAPQLTENGKNLLLRSMVGELITFTRFKIGNGEIMEGDDFTGLDDLINPLIEFSITNIDKSEVNYVGITGAFDNSYLSEDFRWRELGIFCKGEDDVEHLYAYANDGDNAGLIKAAQSDVVIEQNVTLLIAVGDAENVTAIITDSALYAKKEDFDAHVNDLNNPHGVTKEQLQLGNVPNVSTNNQTPTYSLAGSIAELTSGEKLSVAFGKIAEAVKALIEHISRADNPHNVTREQLSAAATEHAHSAADINSGTLGVSRGGTGVQSYTALKSNLGIDVIGARLSSFIHSIVKYETVLITGTNITTATFVYSDIFDSNAGKFLINDVIFEVNFNGETRDVGRTILSAGSVKIYGGASGSKRVWCTTNGKGRAKWSYSIDNGNTWTELCNSIDQDYGDRTDALTETEGFTVIFDEPAKAIFNSNISNNTVLFRLSFVDGDKRYPVAWGESIPSYPWSLTMPSKWGLSFIESDL